MGDKIVLASTAFACIGAAMIILSMISQYWSYCNSTPSDDPMRVSMWIQKGFDKKIMFGCSVLGARIL